MTFQTVLCSLPWPCCHPLTATAPHLDLQIDLTFSELSYWGRKTLTSFSWRSGNLGKSLHISFVFPGSFYAIDLGHGAWDVQKSKKKICLLCSFQYRTFALSVAPVPSWYLGKVIFYHATLTLVGFCYFLSHPWQRTINEAPPVFMVNIYITGFMNMKVNLTVEWLC